MRPHLSARIPSPRRDTWMAKPGGSKRPAGNATEVDDLVAVLETALVIVLSC